MFKIDASSSYEKYGLEKNPFTDLSSEAIRDIERIHVSQEIDSRIADILSDVIGENSGIALALIGQLGSGKTQRLKGVHKLIQESGGMSIYQKIDSNDIIKTTLDIFSYFSEYEEEPEQYVEEEVIPEEGIEDQQSLLQQYPEEKLSFFQRIKRFFSREKVTAPIIEQPEDTELTRENYNSQDIGNQLIDYLGEYKRSALIIDEMENILSASNTDLILFFEFLREFISNMPESCVFIMACTNNAFERIKEINPAFVARLHNELFSEPLTDERAIKLVQKRLEYNRKKSIVNPLYPFEESAIVLANSMSKGNPRDLLKLLHTVLFTATRDNFIEFIDDRYLAKILTGPTSIDEYIRRVPSDLREDVRIIIEKYGGGPVTYIQLAKDTQESVTKQYTKLEELVAMGILTSSKGKYQINSSVIQMVRAAISKENTKKKKEEKN
ncbi:MAG TPA: ATPase [Methanofastidiosum sp.]|nr:ATPase [Methanofastidiosum sp.]HOC77070.1 ATPase [Methanofastidiosum sp.]HOG73335.1 ATPase [Methanofastidiosum sp.]HPA48636.1 ATPase [Methanofastidiosum sp.]HQK62167.1 ATPase [Methanofastidiosum sp.]